MARRSSRRRQVAIPRRPLLRGRRWRVSMRTPKRLGWRRVWGECLDEDRVLLIEPSMTRWQREVSYVHEVLHALWPSGIVDSDTEERLIRGLETRLHAAVASGALAAAADEAG